MVGAPLGPPVGPSLASPAVLGLLEISTVYELLGYLHVLAVIVAFGPLFTYPSMQRAGATQALAKLHIRLALPALTLVWVIGMGLVGASKDAWKLSETWILLSLIAWVVLMLVSWFLIRPAINDTGETARSRLAAGVGITHLLLVVVLYLMIFKPGV
jgi:uncharacterized membrane protein